MGNHHTRSSFVAFAAISVFGTMVATTIVPICGAGETASDRLSGLLARGWDTVPEPEPEPVAQPVEIVRPDPLPLATPSAVMPIARRAANQLGDAGMEPISLADMIQGRAPQRPARIVRPRPLPLAVPLWVPPPPTPPRPVELAVAILESDQEDDPADVLSASVQPLVLPQLPASIIGDATYDPRAGMRSDTVMIEDASDNAAYK